jgi:hypothetical protein
VEVTDRHTDPLVNGKPPRRSDKHDTVGKSKQISTLMRTARCSWISLLLQVPGRLQGIFRRKEELAVIVAAVVGTDALNEEPPF